MEVADAGVLRRQDVAFAATNLRRCQIASLDAVVVAAAVDVGCTDVLIMHRHDVTVVTACVTLLVMDSTASVLRIVRTVDAGKLLHLIIVDVLWCPVILKQCLHVLLVAMGACIVSLQSMRSFHTQPLVVG